MFCTYYRVHDELNGSSSNSGLHICYIPIIGFGMYIYEIEI